MPISRDLPKHPNLEFERKRAKALCRAVRTGDANAILRVTSRHLKYQSLAYHVEARQTFALSDAQFVVAREYGFSSWSRLKSYFHAAQRECSRTRYSFQFRPIESFEVEVQRFAKDFSEGTVRAVQEAVRCIPRLDGAPLAALSNVQLTATEARLVVARRYGFPSWSALETRVTAAASRREGNDQRDLELALAALRERDIPQLTSLLDGNDRLVHLSWFTEEQSGAVLLQAALRNRYPDFHDIAARCVQLLLERGAQFDIALAALMRRAPYVRDVEWIRHLMSLGGVFSWETGQPTPVEEAIMWWNTPVAQFLAEHTATPNALWIDAGLGRVEHLDRWFAPDGTLQVQRSETRPIFGPAGSGVLRARDDAQTILDEAFIVSVMNQQFACSDRLLDRGSDVDGRPWSNSTVLHVAVGNAWERAVDYLIGKGASLHLIGERPEMTPVQMAEQFAREHSNDAVRQRISKLLAGRAQ